MSAKAPDAFRTISEAATELDLPQHVLRHWESTFGAIRPMRRAGGRRYYRLADLHLISGVRALLHGERYTTAGVQKIFKDHGQGFVSAIGEKTMGGVPPDRAVAEAFGQTPTTPAGLDRATAKKVAARLLAAKAEIVALRALLPPDRPG